MNNIKKLLEEIQEEFRKKFRNQGDEEAFDECWPECTTNANDIDDFLAQSNLRVVEKAKEIVENVKITGTRRFDGDDIEEEKAKLMQEMYDKMIKPVLLSALTEQK